MVPGQAERALGSKGLVALGVCVILDETKRFSTLSTCVFSQVDESIIHS